MLLIKNIGLKMSTLTAKYLKDYKETNYFISNIDLNFVINNDKTVLVTNISTYFKNPNSNQSGLILDGNAEIVSVILNDKNLSVNDYEIKNEQLIIYSLADEFTLTITTKLYPYNNKTCMGLYASSGNLLTQCESEGFRKITYYQDRPDVMASFTTHITADKDKFPTLLSNGNKIKEEILDNNQIKVTWQDPFKKPSYLFALVAGKYESIQDEFVTKSGKKIALYIYTSAKYINDCSHAMQSLIKAMKWDEERFNLEYDLNSYIIVATNDFNMGAMENKGLNIFNTKYVLANKDTATDNDFINVEAVIGHEYFHNWTGNRVTCRDWFQLSLKEGLTVFREQEFTADMHNRTTKRIQDVKGLRQLQFPEDAGPLAHSVRPESYIEMNNFYTMTVYEKGAEIVRLYQTILGKDGFNKGLDLYFKRHDGQAVTCDDFCLSMTDANNFDLSQFMLWYSQAGTPNIIVKDYYNSINNEYTLYFEQIIPDTPEQKNKKPMLIPIKIGLLSENGLELNNFEISQGRYIKRNNEIILLLDSEKNNFVIEKVFSKPIPSLLRDFSAPIKLEYEYTYKNIITLIRSDTDEFNRWDKLQYIYSKKIHNIYNNFINNNLSDEIEIEFWDSLKDLLNSEKLSPEFIALAFEIPSFSEILPQIKNANPIILTKAIDYLLCLIGEKLFDFWIEVYNINLTMHYKFEDQGKRKLKNTALFYIMNALKNKLNNPHSLQLAETLLLGQFNNADNMTDSLAVLIAQNNLDFQLQEELLLAFYNKWYKNELVMDKWFSIQAISQLISIEKLNKLMVNKAFNSTNPNKIYSLLRTFTTNGLKFNTIDGYEFIANNIIAIDKFNPQVASSLAKGYAQVTYLNPNYKQMAKTTLQQILIQKNISNDIYEIINKTINSL